MPLVIMSWLNDTTPPRIRVGVCSEMYIGETNEAVPTDNPRTNRAITSSGTFWAKADPSAPST
jgi:hypothetical protein